jgi:hypothetical protein
MHVWHFAPEAQRVPLRVSPGEKAVLWIGTWPIESGQSVGLSYTVERAGVQIEEGRVGAEWKYNSWAVTRSHAPGHENYRDNLSPRWLVGGASQ